MTLGRISDEQIIKSRKRRVSIEGEYGRDSLMTNALYPRLYGFVIWIELVVISRRVGFGRRDFFLGRIFISLLKTMNDFFLIRIEM